MNRLLLEDAELPSVNREWRSRILLCGLIAMGSACGSDTSTTSGSGGDASSGGSTGLGGASSSGGSGLGGASSSGGASASGGTGNSGGAPDSTRCAPAAPTGIVLYVATDGSDDTGDGSSNAPFASIGHALGQVSDGGTVLVRPGTYTGRVRIEGSFETGVTVRSETPYLAKLRHTETVVIVYEAQGVSLEGFDIAHSGAGAGALVVQVQDLMEGAEATERITLRNNVMHDSFNNDILKINNGARQVLVEGNIFYNQSGSDEHIDINSVSDVVVQDNIFFNDFAGSGRTNGNDTSSFIVVKDSNGMSDAYEGSVNIVLQRNVFLNWEGSTGSNFVLLGEDGNGYFEATSVLVQNNLMLGNSANTMRAAFGVKGCKDIVFRHNTLVGDMPSLAFAMRLNREGSNLQNEGIFFYNNVYSDPTGTMEDFSDTPPADTVSFELDNNAFFNGGVALPEDAAELVNPSDDAHSVVGDPLLPAVSGVALPRLEDGVFADGSATICEAFDKLARAGCSPANGSPLRGAALSSQSPEYDLVGVLRTVPATIGACE